MRKTTLGDPRPSVLHCTASMWSGPQFHALIFQSFNACRYPLFVYSSMTAVRAAFFRLSLVPFSESAFDTYGSDSILVDIVHITINYMAIHLV